MQQASSQASRHNSPLLEPRKVLISVLLGLAGFAGAFFSPQFSVPPLTLSILWSYTFPLLAAMAYGARYGLIAGLFGGALYPFFLWETNGWANAITAVLILGWFTWHGYGAQKYAQRPSFWNHPLTVQVLYAAVYAASTRYGYPYALAANPPSWAPQALTSLPVEILNGVVVKGTLNLFLAFSAATTLLILPEVRQLLRLPVKPESRDNSKIVLTTFLSALFLWVMLLMAFSIFIELDFPAGVFPPNDPRELIALVIFIFVGLITGDIIASYVERQQRATLELTASEVRFRSIFEQAAMGITLADLEGRFLRVNQQFCQMTGYTAEELLQRSPQDITHPDDREPNRKLAEKLRRGEQDTFALEKRYIRKDGSHFWANVTVSLQRDLEGKPEYYIAVVEDITARRQMTEALRESELRYRNTFEKVAVGISHTTLDGRFLRINDRFCEITGYSREALLARSFQDITYPGDLPLDEHLAETLLAGKQETYQREKRYLRPDGSLVWVGLTASLLRDENGAPTHFISVIEDITARKQAEEALARERILLRTLIDNLPDAVYVKDLQLRKVLANRADITNMGLTDEASALGKTDFDIFPSEVAAEFAEDDEEVIRTGAPLFDREERLVRPSGEARWLLTSKLPLRDDQGEVIGIIGIGHDITKRRHDEEALRESNRQLLEALAELQDTQKRMIQQERLAAVGQLAAGIAHDFNNILAVIVLYAQMALKAPDLPEGLAGRLRVILEQSKRAADLIQQIVDFSRRAILERRPLDLLPFVKEQLQLLERTLPENIHLTLKAEGDEFIVNADPTRLQQALFNLAVNARDAMPQGGELCIGLRRLNFADRAAAPLPELEPGAWVQLSITDTGSGIPSDVLAHMFEPFFTTKPPGRGTGLGLAQVHGIVKQHQGEIGITTRLGEGTTFTIYLPAVLTRETSAPAPSQEPLALGQGQYVLVVEDDVSVRSTLVNTLELLNYRTYEAANGYEALAIVEQHPQEIALILSDFIMPEMGGEALLGALRQRGLQQPVIILSGYPLLTELDELRAQGLTDWLLKPPEVEHLASVIAQALSRSSNNGPKSS